MSKSNISEDYNLSVVKNVDNIHDGQNDLLNKDFVDEDFKNPLCAPLELVDIPVEKLSTSVPAISAHWATNWLYGEFHENITEDSLRKLSEGFKWLLKLQLHKFWSQIIYEPNTVAAVKSFIIKKRYKHDNFNKDNECDKFYNKIYWSIYAILQRIVHSKISKTQYLYSLFHQYLVQKYKLFSEEIILSICGLYGNKYPHSVQILLEKIFIVNRTLCTVGIKEIARKTEEGFNVIHSFHMKQWFTYILNSKKDDSSVLTVYNVTLSLLHYIQEFLNERRVFIQLYPSSMQWFRYYGIEKLLPWFFEEDIGYISNVLNKINIDEVHIQKVHHQYIWEKMFSTCQEISKMYRLFLLDLIYCAEINRKKNSNFNKLSAEYLELLSNLLQYPRFAKCYILDYDIINDIKVMKKALRNVNVASIKIIENEIEELIRKNNITQRAVDNSCHETDNEFFKLHYDLQSNHAFKNEFKNEVVSLSAFKLSIKMNSISISSDNEVQSKTIEGTLSKGEIGADDFIPNEHDHETSINEDEAFHAAIAESLKSAQSHFVENDVNDIVFESLISEVKSILPYLGEGFISECLKYYNNNTEEIISAILEENLPPQLMSVDQSLPLIPDDPIEKLAQKKCHDRRNVYDNDEFDKMTTKTFDPKRVFRKKNKYDFKDIKSMLDDKSHVRELTERYQTYSCDMYDDDYDEFGCDYQVVIGGDLTADEVENKFSRNFKIKSFNKNVQSASSSSDSEDVDNSSNGQGKSFDAFCVDPAILREQAEARRAQKYQNRNRGTNRNSQSTSRDVVGNPKGQGQDKTVIQNRDHKNAKKSSIANHNRRAGAQWKRNRGMLPS